MPLILILEDEAADLRKASDAAKLAGFTEVEICRFATDARLYLDKALSGLVPMPNAMVVDLNLGVENGFEILRFWHSTPVLTKIPVIVWSILGGREHQLADLFRVYRFLPKQAGTEALSGALRELIRGSGDAGEKLA
jgi:CheY-like chemotaxis protein